jgi:hypothetical protein
MTLLDTLVAWREAALDRLVGVRPGDVLNAGPKDPARGTVRSATDAAADLRRAMAAVVADGAACARRGAGALAPCVDSTAGGASTAASIDYVRLRPSLAYAACRATCAALRAIDISTLASREAQLAFWINLYNALVIDAVVAFGVRRSVTDGHAGYLRFFRRAAYLVGRYRFCCDDIEHGILRANRGHPYLPGPQFGPSDPRRAFVVHPPDPRIHFALNCGSRSCPPVATYDPDHIDAQLERAGRSFIAGDVALDPAHNELRLSRIFRWFAQDFGGRPGVIGFVIRYLPPGTQREWLIAHAADVRLRYQPYDWALNTP